MRTLEVAVGVLVLAAAVAMGFGLPTAFLPLMPSGLGVALPLAALGAALAADGRARLEEHSRDSASGIWKAVAYTCVVAMLATGLPLVSDILDLVSIAGFPLGYYVAAQGLLLLLAILAFRAAHTLETRSGEAPISAAREDR